MSSKVFKIGLIVNPMAGMGGPLALKGSDDLLCMEQALKLGARPKANFRTLEALNVLLPLKGDIHFYTYPQEMGEEVLAQTQFHYTVLGDIAHLHTTPDDTKQAARALLSEGVDLILFVGGDGTARNLCDAIGTRLPVLGIPAGVKIHSGVYAVTPRAAGEVVAMLVRGELVSLSEQDVRDIDEKLFRQGKVVAKFYGELLVPHEHRYVQQVKTSGVEVEGLVLDDMAAYFESMMQPDARYIMGSGSTVAAIMAHLGLDNTLLGVDVIENHTVLASDCTADELLDWVKEDVPTYIVITAIGGQGHIIGRGNQQLSADLLKHLGKEHVLVFATKSKLNALGGRPLIVDSGDAGVNQLFSGLIRVYTGYEDSILYRVTDGS